jgi:uncharacterized protein
MKFIQRELAAQILAAAKSFPAVVLTGPRRSGKTHLLRQMLPEASYHLLEDPDTVARYRADPKGFLDGVKLPVILDEIQNVPDMFNYIRARIDMKGRKRAEWFITGSQEAPLMHKVTESMAGRAAVFQLLPVAARESAKVSLLHGGFPEVLANPKQARLWFSSYLQTYLERDVRSITAVQDLSTFRRFLTLIATRTGQFLNKSDIAGPLGMSVPGVAKWLSILETTQQILIVPPYFENFGKRLTKSPKVFITDSGLACHLLGIDTAAELEKSPFLGHLFEGSVAAEIVKAQVNAGRRKEIYCFRDEQGLEVDFIVPGKGGSVRMIEAKATRTPQPHMAAPMLKLKKALETKRSVKTPVECFLVHRQPRTRHESTALAPGVKAVGWEDFVKDLL